MTEASKRGADRRPATEREAAVLASAVRLRIIRLAAHRPLTNRELAQRLGRDPATTLHHVRRLVDTGFLMALPARRGTRGSREIPYQSTGLSWQLDNVGKREAVAEAMFEAFLGEIADTGFADLRQIRLVMRLDADQRAELENRLYAVIDEFAARQAIDSGERFALYLALYPSA
ncbi:MAG: winged helix-turn-helix transcriptional regulator [Sciscionella sp.]|nr:winged helix-turn-helix transcriptional regulator [Sciscionella sp.]